MAKHFARTRAARANSERKRNFGALGMGAVERAIQTPAVRDVCAHCTVRRRMNGKVKKLRKNGTLAGMG